MNDKELSKRINGAIEELYAKAESAFRYGKTTHQLGKSCVHRH